MPVYSLEDKDELITQFDKDDIESIGLVKFDILGLTTLTIIDEAIKLINIRNKQFDLNLIPLNDMKVFNLLQKKNDNRNIPTRIIRHEKIYGST
jgi:DNA polymerase-3 subunit alpha